MTFPDHDFHAIVLALGFKRDGYMDELCPFETMHDLELDFGVARLWLPPKVYA